MRFHKGELMQVLARRSNFAFIGAFVTAVMIIMWFELFGSIIRDNTVGLSDNGFILMLFFFLLLLFLLFFAVSIRNLMFPRVIIECDDKGSYIYRKFKDTVILRYERILSQYAEQEFNMLILPYTDSKLFWPIIVEKAFYSDKFPGSLRIETPEGFINVYGIAQIKKVESDIADILREKRREYRQALEESAQNKQGD